MKKFFEFIKESNSESYKEIDIIEWTRSTVKALRVGDSFVQRISDFLISKGFKISDFPLRDEDSVHVYTSQDSDCLSLAGLLFRIHIVSAPDEWYYVKYSKYAFKIGDGVAYKCDQYDGLIDCLSNIFCINFLI